MAEKGCVFLSGIALANYRGIGDSPVFIAPFSKFNFMIGPNNAGKSCVLHYIAKDLKNQVTNSVERFGSRVPSIDRESIHLGKQEHQVLMGIGVPVSDVLNQINGALSGVPSFSFKIQPALDYALDKISKNGLIWLKRKNGENNLTGLETVDVDQIVRDAHSGSHTSHWDFLWRSFTRRSGGDLKVHWIPEVLQSIFRIAGEQTSIPEICIIPAIREISQKGHDFSGLDGTGLIDQLAKLQNPGPYERELRDEFEKINNFLRSVIQKNDACIEIPHDREHVLVHIDGKVLPLSSLGTGVHEIVMLASFCTMKKNQIICVEEPEIHLHPLLQRRFMAYLDKNTNNQYFIATHSAALIDTPGASVFNVSNVDGATNVTRVIHTAEKMDALSSLGYKASDLLQTNSVVWVEGPSDRIYLRHWISAAAPDLKEGIDYSIMFYGGRLLSHLSADDPILIQSDIDALIAVRKLNQNIAIVIDSDRDKKGARINATKSRIRNELAEHGGVSWITAGREIENYIPQKIMQEALSCCCPNFKSQIAAGEFDHVLPYEDNSGKKRDKVDKVSIAKAVCMHPADLDTLDLRKKIFELVAMIRKANN